MKYLDFTDLLDGAPASVAILSTFQFDPDYFERRLLASPVLVKARRILVFMDAREWWKTLRQDTPTRLLNRRYLVVPVQPPNGVFHPKLSLIARQDGGEVLCGSNNLTRSGCSGNLELLNAVALSSDADTAETLEIAQEAHRFFVRACDDAEQDSGAIARRWLDELVVASPWLRRTVRAGAARTVRLAHSYGGGLWDDLIKILDASPPLRLAIMSPFHDKDAALLRRFRQRWPRCEVELIVQQNTTTLSIGALKGETKGLRLSELRSSSRRLHAKLIAWESGTGGGCLAGSANFTSAAFDARNVEACFVVTGPRAGIADLFDGQLPKRPLAWEDFSPGVEQAPGSDEPEIPPVRLISALLTEGGRVQVRFRHQLPSRPTTLLLAIRTPDERRPRALLPLPNIEEGSASLALADASLKDLPGSLLASVIAETGGRREESPAVWVIQESRLTYEPSGENGGSTRHAVEESGAGLTEFLEEIGKRDGIGGVIQQLRQLSIQFYDGGDGAAPSRRLQVRIRDPFHPDVAPEWMANLGALTGNLLGAIKDFCERHDRTRLRKHARRGNLNGMENFLDIFTALVRLLYVYFRRGVVPCTWLVGNVCNYVEIAVCGFEREEDASDGYLDGVVEKIRDRKYVRQVCTELNYTGHVWAGVMVSQFVRSLAATCPAWEGPPKRAREYLPEFRARMRESLVAVGVGVPSRAEVETALESYKMFTADELRILCDEIVI